MKNILVPVDFTSESFHALRYAHVIASRLHMGITIAHVHDTLPDPVTGGAYDAEVMRQNRDRLNDFLIKFHKEISPKEEGFPVETQFEIGDIQSHIYDLASDDKYAMIIMSTESEHTFLKPFLGSVSTHVGRNSPKPAIILPMGAPIKYPENIITGVSEELLRDDAIADLFDLVDNPTITLDFVHICNDLPDHEILKDELIKKIRKYNKRNVSFVIHRVSFANETIEEALTDYINLKRADLAVLTTHHRSLLDSLGHRSITKKMLLNPALPVMILHSHHEKGVGLTNELYNLIKEG